MALGLCKIYCDIAKNLYKKPFSLSQKVVSCKFIHNNGIRNNDACDLRKIVSETVIKLSRPNINPFETFTSSGKESKTQGSRAPNLESSQTCSSTCNYNVNKCYKRIIELQPTPLQKYWSSYPQQKDNFVVRYYSSNKKSGNKCKKDNEKCRKMNAPCCDAPARKSCIPPVDEGTCCKQEAPYPSYSEKCVEEVINKPSECKLCPWTPDKHPYFEYVDEFPHFRHPKKPRKQQDHCKNKRPFSTQVSTAGRPTFKNDSSGSVLSVNQDEILSICSNIKLDKKPCKPPPPKCKPQPPKCDKDKKPEKKKKQDDCNKKCSNLNKEDYLLDSLSNLEMGLRSKTNKNEYVKKGKIRKFPFPNPPPVKQIDTETPCPKRKIKSPIKDCPTGGGCAQCLPNTTLELPEPEPESPLRLHTVISSDHPLNENEPFPLLFKECDDDSKCPPNHEKSKICPKETLILPKRKKVKRPPLCSEKEGNKKGK